MAVFTPLTQQDMVQILTQYTVGQLDSYREIGQGIENSNFFVFSREASHPKQTDVQKPDELTRWVLTVFETLKADELPFFMALTTHLADSALPVPAPQITHTGKLWLEVRGKPAALFPCLRGEWVANPSRTQCAALGRYLAKMHVVLRDFSQTRAQPRDMAWITRSIKQLQGLISAFDERLLHNIVQFLEDNASPMQLCSVGTVHGDLFRDNVLFTGDSITGVIDFYHSCQDYLLFDLAVATNDWCLDAERGFLEDKHEAMVSAYRGLQTWTQADEDCWPAIQLLAALRFWLSRLLSRYLGGYQGQSTQGDITKDPDEFKCRILHIVRRYQLFPIKPV
ncbi:homoserine kinase [Oleiphilus messinensis]|uniref:Homoserine kinase n=1 Tax=Oleiphilus messinensis TaxID=141451 RepID=A0A1Y0I3K1_9GAMM|nr:homoserine kinase [Oleiphilus messinensis]ARU55052.1 homoserine kinase [Oleiphilus messinensis]